jgi:hypothetical protein
MAKALRRSRDALQRAIDRRFASKSESTGTVRVWQEGNPIGRRIAFISTFWKSLPLLTPFTLATELVKVDFSVIIVVTTDGKPDVPSINARLKASSFDISWFTLVWRDNIGKDFGCFKDAFHHFRRDIDQAEVVFLGNDSLVGPLFPSDYFMRLRDARHGMWGPTESFDRSFHLQSSHLVLSGRAVIDQAKSFFNVYPFYKNRTNIVKKGEVGLSTWISRAQHNVEAFYPMGLLVSRKQREGGEEGRRSILVGVNPQHFFFDSLLAEGFPFIKRELLVSNPQGLPNVVSRVIRYMENAGQSPDLLFQHFRPV